jgi:para-nitrobenzyl esterase
MKHLMATRPALLARVMGLALTVMIATATAPAQSAAGEPTLVQVDGGTVRGTAANDVIAFKGIPFAQPPVGALRWRPPQPVAPWKGVLEASHWQSDCVQLPSERTSEDCLYANVWRPASAWDKPLPVMVWIYGGGLVRGGASIYPGDFLARQGLVFVSFNYRIGRLGFFAHPALAHEAPDAPRGNYGYMDQIAALQWVQRNIAAFGGDPNTVTIAGESAGGGSVLVLLTSPMARGLFHRAILESPGIPTPRAGATPLRDLVAAEMIAVDYARAAGITGDDAAALAALRALPTAKVAEGTEAQPAIAAMFGGPQVLGISNSIIDGRLVVETPEAALRAGRHAMVPVISGANDYDLAISMAQTKEALFAQFGPLAAHARALYDPRGDASLKELIQAIIADRVMVEPSRHLAEMMAKSGQPAYFYRFSYVPEPQRGKVPGATHASEILFAFDAASAVLKETATNGDVDMARTMSGYWAGFVKTGNPNGEGRPEWPRYDPNARGVLNFTNTGVTAGPDPLKERLDLWQAVWERGC